MRSHTAEARAAATRRVVELEQAQQAAKDELDAARRRLEDEFARKRADLERQMAPLRAELAKITEIAWTLDLYLGRDEEVTLLRDGRPAAAGEPITIRQMVLAADEESLLFAEAGGIDYRRMDAFIGWVAADPAHMERIIPDAKGVVVVVPSRQRRDYGDPVHNAAAEEANRRAHWLLRNGERLYLLVTDPELVVGDRLLPARDEFTSLFTERDHLAGERTPLVPGSDAWLRAEQRAGELRRHYMRKMLVLQGIVDRSVVWQPLPVPGLNLLSVAAQDAGHVRLVNEIDMALADGRPRFRQWQQAMNRRLRPGMRVVISTTARSCGAERYDGDRWTRGGHRRLTPRGASNPPEGVPLTIEGRRDGGLVVRYARTDQVWKRDVPVPDQPGYVYGGLYPVPASLRASCLIYPGDQFVLPFDAASEEDLAYYLNSREDRRGYLDMVPVLRSALEAKRAEREAEAGFRELLAGVILARHPDADPGEVEGCIPALVTWWKTGGKNARPLAGDPEGETRAVEGIAREWALRRTQAGDPAASAAAVAAARDALGDRLLAVARTRGGQYKAWSPAYSTGAGPWLREHTLAAADDGWQATVTAEWVTIHPRTLATMQILHASSRWGWWDLYPATGEILTGPEADALARQMLDHMTGEGATPIIVTARAYDDDYGRRRPAREITGYAWPADSDVTDLTRPDLDHYLTCFYGTWARGRAGEVTMTVGPGHARWQAYSGWPQAIARPESSEYTRHMCWPWRDPGNSYWDPESSRRLVWHDPAQVSRVLALYMAREHRREQARQAEDEAANHHYAAAIREAAGQAWLREKTAEARTRFDQDYGREAADLWEHHLATLALGRRYKPPRWLDEMSRRLARARVSVDGKTFAELASIDAGLHTGEPVDVGGWAAWVVRMPASDDAATGEPAGGGEPRTPGGTAGRPGRGEEEPADDG
jgi:hypothetical protein